MIVVVGGSASRLSGDGVVADGLAARVAIEAATAGASVELITKVGNDPAGDAVLLALTRAGVGHVATLRDPARPTPVLPVAAEPADLDEDDDSTRTDGPGTTMRADAPVLERDDVSLALRYLTDFRVVVAIHAADEVLEEVVAAAGWVNARLVAVLRPDTEAPASLPPDALVVAASLDEAEGLARRIGRYAVAVDRGEDIAAAYAALTAAEIT